MTNERRLGRREKIRSPPSVTAVTMAAMRYQSLLVNVVSTIGAHSAFQVCGRRLIATSPATAATLTPAWDRR